MKKIKHTTVIDTENPNSLMEKAVEDGLFDCTDNVNVKIKKKNRFFHFIKNLIKWFQPKKFSDSERDRLVKLAGIDSDSKKVIVSEQREPTFVISGKGVTEESVSIKSKSSFIADEGEKNGNA